MAPIGPTGTSRLYRPDPARLGRDERWGRAEASATVETDPVVVTVRGEIDASNGRSLTSFVERHASIDGTLVLDLSAVAFFGTAGLTALRRIDLCCDRIGWLLVASPAVRRALRACQAEDLPQSESVAVAVRALSPTRAADQMKSDPPSTFTVAPVT